ncbi:hypothetical protein [Nonomuraea angiospora]
MSAILKLLQHPVTEPGDAGLANVGAPPALAVQAVEQEIGAGHVPALLQAADVVTVEEKHAGDLVLGADLHRVVQVVGEADDELGRGEPHRTHAGVSFT